MERLIRFGQVHDLLRKTAERAQKLDRESNAALEAYRRQVPTPDVHLAHSDGLYVCSTPYTFWCRRELIGGYRKEQVERLTAETMWELKETNVALQLAQDKLRAVWSVVSEREQAQRLALLDEINLVKS
jgi:hypothetical protein